MVDICRPPLQWIDGRCYRRQAEQECAVYPGYTGEEGCAGDPGLDHAEELQHEIEEIGGGQYRAVLQIAAPFFPNIIGKGGDSKRRLEQETMTRITVPAKGKEGDVIVVGRNRRGVSSAANRLDLLVASVRSKMAFTHFLSIPVNTPTVREAFLTFKDEILTDCGSVRGMDSSIFQTASMLHLTLGTMALLDDRERSLAKELLEECRDQVLEPVLGQEDLVFNLTGLEYMNDDPGEVDVLYCGVKDDTGRLQEAVDRIVDRFVVSGLMQKEYDRVKLHCTLLNTRFRREEGELDTELRESFDASHLLEGWGSLDLGQVSFDEIHLSQRVTRKKTSEGYYQPSAVLRIKSSKM